VQWDRSMPHWGGAKDVHGGLDFRTQHQIKAYKKTDIPPKIVEPMPIIIIIYIMAKAYGEVRSDDEIAITYMISITLFLLIRPDDYTGTISHDAAFKLQDVQLYIQNRYHGSHLDVLQIHHSEERPSEQENHPRYQW
jgi:hypothetical protein